MNKSKKLPEGGLWEQIRRFFEENSDPGFPSVTDEDLERLQRAEQAKKESKPET